MSEAIAENLTERERTWLEHVRQAQELRVSLTEYCRSFELNIKQWYTVRPALVRKGVLPAAARAKTEEKEKTEEPKKSAGFVPVQVMPALPAATAPFRLQHASGWTIECASVPAVSWIKALMSGVHP